MSDDDVTRSMPTPGLLDGRYRLEHSLGRGGVAEVFEALDEKLSRRVAIKLFRGDAAEELQRHESEMRTLAQLDHPALVTVYDAGQDGPRPYLVMQLIEGTTLAAEITRRGTIPADVLASWGATVAAGLAYVHGQGVIHRDVKPANVLLAVDGRVHLADFGIARLVDSAHVTRAGEIVGTPAYFAPEQVSGETVGPAADVYSLGLVLLECLTGRRAFEGTSWEVAVARLSRDPELPADLEPAWRSLLRGMLARTPGQRPVAAEAAQRLRALAGEDTGALGLRSITPPVVAPVVPAPIQPTQILPAATMSTTRLPTSSIPVSAASYPEPRRGQRIGIVIAILVLAVAIAGGIFAVVERGHQGPNQTSTWTPGEPRIANGHVEKAMEELEKAVKELKHAS